MGSPFWGIECRFMREYIFQIKHKVAKNQGVNFFICTVFDIYIRYLFHSCLLSLYCILTCKVMATMCFSYFLKVTDNL